jgi:glutathione S-transferase
MKLVIATPSPFARKVRVALREKNIEFNEVVDVPWNKDTITKNFNPLGKIPILIEKNKEPLFDSKVIVQYLDHINEAQLMYPKDPQNNIGARLIESVEDGVCDAIVLVFLENSRNETLRSNDWVQR